MKEVTMYMANDGKFFETVEDCLNYEKEKESKVNKVWKAMQVLVNYCKINQVCNTCPFYEKDSSRPSCYCKLKLNTPARWGKEYIDTEKL